MSEEKLQNKLSNRYSYNNLILSIKNIVSTGLVDAEKALQYHRLKTYWKVGNQIIEFVENSKGILLFGEELYDQISSEISRECNLDLTADTLRRIVYFSREYKKFPENTNLTFTHYLALMSIKDKRLRLKIEKKSSKTDMSSLEIRNEILVQQIDSGGISTEDKVLEVNRGTPFVYSVIKEFDVSGNKQYRIDCGFNINVEYVSDSYKPSQKRVVKVLKQKGKYNAQVYRKGKTHLYTYPAYVSNVVDGDTFDARIDVGFSIGLNARLRLKGINTPEIKTQEGKAAKAFLIKYFSKTPLIIVRTSKAGMFGRWITDVFSIPKCSDPNRIAEEGEYLNQRILDEGLAELY